MRSSAEPTSRLARTTGGPSRRPPPAAAWCSTLRSRSNATTGWRGPVPALACYPVGGSFYFRRFLPRRGQVRATDVRRGCARADLQVPSCARVEPGPFGHARSYNHVTGGDHGAYQHRSRRRQSPTLCRGAERVPPTLHARRHPLGTGTMPRRKTGVLDGVPARDAGDTVPSSSPAPRPAAGGRKKPQAAGRPPIRVSERLSRARVVPSSALESAPSAPMLSVTKAASAVPVVATAPTVLPPKIVATTPATRAPLVVTSQAGASTAAVSPTVTPSPTVVPARSACTAGTTTAPSSAASSPTAVGAAGAPTAVSSPTCVPAAVAPTALPTTVLAVVSPAAVSSPADVSVGAARAALPVEEVSTAVPTAVGPTNVPAAVPEAVTPAAEAPTAVPSPTAVSAGVARTAVSAGGAPAAVPATVAPAAVAPTSQASPTAMPAAVVPTAVSTAVRAAAVSSPTAVPAAFAPVALTPPALFPPTAVPESSPAAVPVGVPPVVQAASVVPTSVPTAVAVPEALARLTVPAVVAPTSVSSPTAVSSSPTDVPVAVASTAVLVPAPPVAVTLPTAVPVAVAHTGVRTAVSRSALPAAGAVTPGALSTEQSTANVVSSANCAATVCEDASNTISPSAMFAPEVPASAVTATLANAPLVEVFTDTPGLPMETAAVTSAMRVAVPPPTVGTAPTALPIPPTAHTVPAALAHAGVFAATADVPGPSAMTPTGTAAHSASMQALLPVADTTSTGTGRPQVRFAVPPPPRRAAGDYTPRSTGPGSAMTTAPHGTLSSTVVDGSTPSPSPVAAVRQAEASRPGGDGEGSDITSPDVGPPTSQGPPRVGLPHSTAGGGAVGAPVGPDQGVAGPSSRSNHGEPSGLPEDGVYSLPATTRAQMGTLLRVLFQVRTSSDQSILPFLAVAHYMMAFSYLAGVPAGVARTRFFDALRVAFENPVSMKRFMETSFRCGHQGLHVGGRTKLDNHVAGQPDGLRKDALNLHLNPMKLKGQWLCRRLLLRTHVDVQVGAHSPPGGLTAADRECIATSLADGSTCGVLRELGCTVKFSKGGPAGKRPMALAFRWDASSTWFGGGIEADLVGVLRKTLLKVTPVIHSDRDLVKTRLPKLPSRPGSRKRSADPSTSDGPPRATKKSKDNQAPSSDDLAAACCSKCGKPAGDDGSTSTQVTPAVTPTEEYWSADVVRSPTLPHGGHVLSCSLPMHMDAGPSGRVHVHVDVSKTSAVGAPAFAYSFFVSASTLAPAPVDAVPGASFSSPPAQGPVPASYSLDLLRAVKKFLAQREQSMSVTREVPNARTPSDVQVNVRHAQTPVPLVVRFSFVSAYELSLRAELVERVPGRVTVFLVGLQPPPVGGSVVL